MLDERLMRVGIVDGIHTEQDITNLRIWSDQKWHPKTFNVSYTYLFMLIRTDKEEGDHITFCVCREGGKGLFYSEDMAHLTLRFDETGAYIKKNNAPDKSAHWGHFDKVLWQRLFYNNE